MKSDTFIDQGDIKTARAGESLHTDTMGDNYAIVLYDPKRRRACVANMEGIDSEHLEQEIKKVSNRFDSKRRLHMLIAGSYSPHHAQRSEEDLDRYVQNIQTIPSIARTLGIRHIKTHFPMNPGDIQVVRMDCDEGHVTINSSKDPTTHKITLYQPDDGTLVVWDFHGVLEVGMVNTMRDISNAVLHDNGYEVRMSTEEANRLYGLRWNELFMALSDEIDYESSLILQEDGRRMQQEHPEMLDGRVSPTPYAHSVLEHIANEHEQILVSNTNKRALHEFIALVEMTNFFGPSNTYPANEKPGVSKEELVRGHYKGNAPQRVIVVGDTPADMELGAALGAERVLYRHPGLEFPDCDSDYKTNDLRDVLAIVHEGGGHD